MYRAAGGKGNGSNASDGSNGTGWSGANNRGDGGQTNGNAGDSGVVIIRYPSDYSVTDVGLTHSTSTDGDFKVTTITAGTGNLIFNS